MSQLSIPVLSADDMRATLAAELAIGLLPVKDLLERFDLSAPQLKTLLQTPEFRGMVKDYKQAWHSASNVKERVRLKAAIATEEGLLELYQIFNNMEFNPSARLEAFKQLTALSDVAPKKDAIDHGPGFHLTLNLGGDPKTGITLEAVPNAALTEGE